MNIITKKRPFLSIGAMALGMLFTPRNEAQTQTQNQTQNHPHPLFQSCIPCHGVKGEGMKDKRAPKIGGQHDWYILESLKKFKAGERPHPKMFPLGKRPSDEDLKELSLYIGRLK